MFVYREQPRRKGTVKREINRDIDLVIEGAEYVHAC